MPVIYILVVSLLLQLGAVALSLRLIRTTGWRLAWSAVAIAMGLMGLRSGFVLFDHLSGKVSTEPDLALEYFSLIVSLLLVIGFALIRPLLSALREADRNLAESERLFRTLAGNTPTMLWMSDSMGRSTFFNKRWLQFTGRTADETQGKSWVESLHPEDRQRCLDTYFAALNAREGFEMEYRLRRFDGEYRWIFDTGVPRFSADGCFAGLIGAGTDITARKQAEDALKAAKEDAESASRTKSAFLANMSHELRTPLNAIIGFSEIIKDEMLGPVGHAKYRDYAEDIYGSGVMLLDLINDILDFSKAEAGKLQPRDEAIDIRESIAASLRLVRDDVMASGITFVEEVPPDLPAVRADARMMKQILLNLLSNAVKFTPAGGTITVGASVDSKGRFLIFVRDTGIGIAAKDIPEVMAAFGQVRDRMSRHIGGTGLGLPLVKSLAEAHGGTFELDSEPEAGTTVTVRLPANRVIREAVPEHAQDG